MTLRKKTLVSITITTLLLIAVMLLLSSRIILGSFSRLEEQSIRQNAQQTLRLLEDEMAKLESTLKDWSNWDDTYQFAADVNRDYVENNLTNPDHCATGAVLERIGAALAQPFEIDGQTIDFVSASIGAKQFPADAETAEELIKAADREMYRVKNQRKHTTICALIEQHQQRRTA